MKDFKILALGVPVRLSAKEADSLYKELEAKDKKIAELKEIVSVLAIADETGYVDGCGYVVDFNKITDAARDFLLANNIEQQRKGFWLGFEDARCHPDEMNILNQWENTKVFIESKGGAE
jgi:hypothetical protein